MPQKVDISNGLPISSPNGPFYNTDTVDPILKEVGNISKRLNENADTLSPEEIKAIALELKVLAKS